MKKFFAIVFSAGVVFLSGCLPEDLPNPTQDGLNSFGMIVNGKNWEPSLPGFLFPSPPTKGIRYDSELNYIYVFARDNSGEKHEVIQFYVSDLHDIGIYKMSLKDPRNDTSACSINTKFDPNRNNLSNCKEAYFLIDIEDSKVELTKFDTINNIISGTFEAKMVNSETDALEITEGRFDFEF